jgi:hypothetical protein
MILLLTGFVVAVFMGMDMFWRLKGRLQGEAKEKVR